MQRTDPTRRRLLVAAASASTGVVAGCQSRAIDRELSFASLAEAEFELLRLAAAPGRTTAATWSWAQTLAHCAQSIEYSLRGFPQPKPVLFQATAGKLAFTVFTWRGRMTHDLAEPIPGAPTLEPALPEAQALARLRAAITEFRSWAGALQPHFAYGELDKPAYERAHAMHLAEHLSGFRVQA